MSVTLGSQEPKDLSFIAALDDLESGVSQCVQSTCDIGKDFNWVVAFIDECSFERGIILDLLVTVLDIECGLG